MSLLRWISNFLENRPQKRDESTRRVPRSYLALHYNFLASTRSRTFFLVQNEDQLDNSNMLTLKCVLFLLFGAVGSLLPFIPLHMNALDLSRDEAVIVSGIAPLIALIGPLVAAPLSDRLACGFGGAPRSKTDRYLRVMIGTCCVLATIFYWLLTLIPAIMRSPPHVSFMCDEAGGFILQDRCGAERTCYNWGSGKGSVLVKNCIFSCNATSAYKGESSTSPPVEEVSAEYGEDYYDAGTYIINEPEGVAPPQTPAEYIQEPYPHMCFKNASGSTICEVYTEYYSIKLNLGLLPSAPNQQNETDDTCKYPFAEPFACRMPSKKVEELKKEFGSDDCNPVVVCEILDPYNNTDSLLKRSQCGYDNISFWLYLFIKSFADIFIAAAVALIGTAVVIATRETSTGRGDIGKQFACGVAGFGLFAPIIGGCADGRFFEGIICFTVLMVLAVIILLADEKMPLSPPEWWWHHPLRPTGASDVFSQKVWTGNGSTGHHSFAVGGVLEFY
uniref:Major facilitator superfamily associated domain-containing protein n=3 Tax=Dendroctonus ponderosae TaxID=77166 RepID=A0AAR5QD40_DENPD